MENYKIELSVTIDDFVLAYFRGPKNEKEFIAFCEKCGEIVIDKFTQNIFFYQARFEIESQKQFDKKFKKVKPNEKSQTK